MKHWLRKNKPSEPEVDDQPTEVFGEIFNPDNDAPVRVRSVKEFVVNIIEESQKKDAEIDQLNKQLEALESVVEERDVARLALEQSDLTNTRLKQKIDGLQKKVEDQKHKIQQLRDERNDLKLKLSINKTPTRRSRKEKHEKV